MYMLPEGSRAIAVPVSTPFPAKVSVKRRLPEGSSFETKTSVPAPKLVDEFRVTVPRGGELAASDDVRVARGVGGDGGDDVGIRIAERGGELPGERNSSDREKKEESHALF